MKEIKFRAWDITDEKLEKIKRFKKYEAFYNFYFEK